MIKQKKNAWCS